MAFLVFCLFERCKERGEVISCRGKRPTLQGKRGKKNYKRGDSLTSLMRRGRTSSDMQDTSDTGSEMGIVDLQSAAKCLRLEGGGLGGSVGRYANVHKFCTRSALSTCSLRTKKRKSIVYSPPPNLQL